jgi:hypothetical protein
MTRYALDWPGLGGHRVYNTRAEAQAHAARIKVGRGEDAVITELPDEPVVPAPALHSTPTESAVTLPDPLAAFEAAVAVKAALPAQASCGEAAAVAPTSANAGPTDPKVIDRVLTHLIEHDDERIAKSAARAHRYLAEHAAGTYIPPRFLKSKTKPF